MAPMKCPAAKEPLDDFDDSCTLTHLAHRWHVTRREVRHLLQRGELPFVDVRGQIRVPYAAVEDFERRSTARQFFVACSRSLNLDVF